MARQFSLLLWKGRGSEGEAVTEENNPTSIAASTGSPVGLLAQAAPGPRQLRSELEELVARELLGPRGAPDEEVTENRLQDRYLVGMLAPKNKRIRAGEMDTLAEDGAGTVEDGATDDSALAAASLFPSSIGLTCIVHGSVTEIMVTGRWGRYAREKSESVTTAQGNPQMVWKRHPMGNIGKRIALTVGDIPPTPLDPSQPEVYLQGLVRKLDGDWIVSLFLVNGQQETERLKDEAWVFQPELEVAATDGSAIFRRRHWLRDAAKLDVMQYAEQRALEMLCRKRVDLAQGRGVAVHANTDPDEPTRGVRLTTRVMPTREVPMTTAPTVEDIPALADLVLDMKVLSELDDAALIATLRVLLWTHGVVRFAYLASRGTQFETSAHPVGSSCRTHLPSLRGTKQSRCRQRSRARRGIATSPSAPRDDSFESS